MSIFDKDIIEKEIPFREIFENKIIDIIGNGLTQLNHANSTAKLITNERYLENYIRNSIYDYIHEIGAFGRYLDWGYPIMEDYVYVHVFSGFSMISVAVKKEVCMKLDKDLEFTLCMK